MYVRTTKKCNLAAVRKNIDTLTHMPTVAVAARVFLDARISRTSSAKNGFKIQPIF